MGISIASNEELWVVLTTVLLLAKFTVGSLGLRFSSRRLVAPAVRLLQILNYYAVTYTLGLMKPSSASCFFFQVWAVLIVTMQQSRNIGRPYRPKEMSLVDLLTALWSANELEAAKGTPPRLEAALWLIWSTNAARIIWYYVSSHRTASAATKGVKVVSDYMATAQHAAAAACPRTMKGYRYLVVGEEELRMDVAPPAFTPEMVVPPPPSRSRIVTVEEVWEQAQAGGGDRLLGEAADRDSRFKDVCLSLALYKLQSRRFHDFPITEAAHPATRRLVAGAVLEEGPDGGGYERALRVTEAELSFLRGSIYSKHAVVFAAGFPCVRLLLSLLMTAATLYLFYAVRDMHQDQENRISHGVVVTRCIIAIIVFRELMEVGVYVLSQWTKAWIICHYVKLKRRQGHGHGHGRVATLRRLAAEKAARIMFAAIWRGRWDQRIRQYNLLMSARTRFPLVVRKVKLQSEVKRLVFGSLKAMIMSVPDHHHYASWAEQTNALLMSYFRNAFADGHGRSTVEDTAAELEGDTHRILVWHVATSLCQIKLLVDEAAQGAGRGADLYSLPPAPTAAGKLPAAVPWPQHYAAAVSLSNYCAYLATQALVPDNGLVANKVFDAVRGEARNALRGCGAASLAEIRQRLVTLAGEGDGDATIVGMGARLSEKILSLYGTDEMWERLGKFWAGFLLHLSASTRAAKHRIHLQGRGELTTHLWVLLSHAGFLGSTSHGEQLLDPDDLNDA